MKSKQFNRNLYIIAPAIIIFAVGYYFYIEVYTKNKEANIISTKSRILEQMSHNLEAKVNSMGMNASEYVKYVISQVSQKSPKNTTNSKDIKQRSLKTKQDTPNSRTNNSVLSMNQGYQQPKQVPQKSPKNTINSKNKGQPCIQTEQGSSDSISFKSMLIDRKFIEYYNKNLEYLNSSVKEKARPEANRITVTPIAKAESLHFQIVLGENYKTYCQDTIEFTTKYDLLMTGLIQQNIFDEYILIVDSAIFYSSLPNKPNIAIIEQVRSQSKGDESGLEKERSTGYIDLVKSGKTSTAAISGVTTYDINLSNQPYKLFICQVEVEKKTWHLGGLVKTGLINQSKKEMAPWIGIAIFMVLSLIILGLPFIKLKVMSPTELLTSGTLLNTAISLFLGTSFMILFIFFGSNFYWKKTQNEFRLIGLADSINNSLNTEIYSAFTQLNYYDSAILVNAKVESLPFYANILKSIPGARHEYPLSYPYFDYVFWIDTIGNQKGSITPFVRTDDPSNYISRAYFKYAGEWMLPGNETNRFRIESIVSRTSGDVKVALSKKSKFDMVTVMTGRFYSIIQPIIPEDYKFCIIDKSGLVWFHSDKLRNMQENFKTECNNDESLSAAIFANTAKNFDVNYYDKPYHIYIKPLSPMPLYLVTMYDKHGEYAYQVQGLMMTLLLFSAFVMFILLEIFALNALKPFGRKSGWKNVLMDFVGAKGDQSSIYAVLSVLFVLITIFYLGLTNSKNILNPLLFALVMVSFLFPFIKYALKGFSLKSNGRNIFAILNLAFIILINIASVRLFSQNDLINLVIFQVIIIALLAACYFVLKTDFTIKYSNCSVTFYICFLLGLLLVFSVAPSIKFFEASVNYEMIMEMKHDQLMLARQRESRNKQLREYYKLMEKGNKGLDSYADSVYQQRMEMGIYSNIMGTSFHIQNKQSWNEIDDEIKKTAKGSYFSKYQEGEDLINFFRPIYDSTSIETKYLVGNSLLNGNQRWLLSDSLLVFRYTSATENDQSKIPDSCKIVTEIHRPDIFNPRRAEFLFPRYDIFFILLLLSVFYGIYLLILFGTRRMLGISIIEMYNKYNFENFVYERLSAGHSVMVIGSPFVNLEEHLKVMFKDKFKFRFQNFSKSEDIVVDVNGAGENDVLVITEFAFDYYSVAALKMQLAAINKMIRRNEKMVIVGMNAPYLIQDYLEKKMKGTVDLKDKDKAEAIAETCEQLLFSFNNLLSNVSVLHAPQKYDQFISSASCYSKPECGHVKSENVGDYGENLKCSICKELAASTYLEKYVDEMMIFYDQLVDLNIPREILKDRIIARIMDLSQLYYDSILASCTPMEQFVLGDMAHDMIVNSKNKKVIFLLINRGLLVVNGCTIRFMNESFRKHVIHRFTVEEEARLKERLGDTGTSWHGYKLILVLIMIGLILFLFIANRSILDNLNKLFLVIGGGTVLITNLTGLLTRKEAGNTK